MTRVQFKNHHHQHHTD
ncbi:his operon leader peptide [Salmonella enterica subsp. enterica serovar Infantis]